MTKDEALDLALEALEKSLPRLAPYGEQDWLDSRAAITAIKQARSAPVQEPVAWVDLLKQAEEVVRSKSLWKKYIDGTPLANDIAVWMASFAQEHTTLPAQPAPVQPVAWWNGEYGSPVFAFKRDTPGIGLGNPDATPLYATAKPWPKHKPGTHLHDIILDSVSRDLPFDQIFMETLGVANAKMVSFYREALNAMMERDQGLSTSKLRAAKAAIAKATGETS